VKIEALEGPFLEVLDLDDEVEPKPAPIDHCATNFAKMKRSHKVPPKVEKMNPLVKALMWKAHNMMVDTIIEKVPAVLDDGPFNSQNNSLISHSPSGRAYLKTQKSQINLLKLLEQSKASHLLDRGAVGKEVRLIEPPKKEENPLFKLSD